MKKTLNKLIRSQITVKLSLLVSMFVIIAFMSFEIYHFLHTKSEVTQTINKEQYAKAKFIAQDIKDKIDKRSLFIGGLADIIAPTIMQSEAQLLATLKNHLKLTNIFPQGFAVFRPSGVGVLAEYPIIPGRSTFSFAQSAWFIQALKSTGVVTSTPSISKVNGELLMPMAKAIRDKNGHVLGVLASPLFLNTPGFMDYIFDENHRQEGDILVASRDDEIFVAASDPTFLLQPTPSLGENKFYDDAMSGFNGYDAFHLSDDNKMLTAVADIDEPNWFVIVQMPIETAYNELYEHFYLAVFNGVVVSLITLVSITFSLFLFFMPLREAVKSVKVMLKNPQSLMHIKIYKMDEIGTLVSGFNSLIDMVNERNINLEKANAVLESLSQTDGLTGAANRRHFDQTLSRSWRVQVRNQQPLTLLLIDIDYFKQYNDTYGHLEGDECLKNVSKAIENTLNRPTDFFARYGGEEFVVLLHGDMKEGRIVAEKVRLSVSDLGIEHTDSSYKRLTISLGVASIIPQLNSDSAELIKKADLALYKSKDNGRNRYEYMIDEI